MRAGRVEELELHPTVKPVQMIADAIRDTYLGEVRSCWICSADQVRP